MKLNEKLSIRDFYSPWYGIICSLLLGLFYICLAFPMLRITTQAGSTFTPNGYAFMFGFSVDFPELSIGIVEVAKFNIIMAIPFILATLTILLFLCSKFSVLFGLIGAAVLITSGVLITQVTNFEFYGNAILPDYVSIIRHSEVKREFGYYLSSIILFVIAAVAIVFMAVMRLKARRLCSTPLI